MIEAHDNGKIEMLEGQLNRFFMLDDETPQNMFNRLKKMVNKAKAMGVQEVDRSHVDQMVDEDLDSNELQCGCFDPPRSHLQEDDIR
jgi:SPX domain protein involved in polyphosphate accumulation